MANIELADRNLQLALLDEAYRHRAGSYHWLLSLQQEYTAYQRSAGGPTWEELEPRLGTDDAPALVRFLLTLPLTAADLAKMTRLRLDGDREIYMLYPGDQFRGHFAISSLDGIGHCTTLVDLDLNSMVDPCSLAPLAGLTGLRRLTVDGIDQHRDLDAIITLPALTDLRFWNIARAENSEAWPGVISALRARGVSVQPV
jgi:hypothetical protein